MREAGHASRACRRSPSSSTATGRSTSSRRTPRRPRAQGARARRLPGDVRARVPVVALGEGARRLGRPAREGGVRVARAASRSRCRARRRRGSATVAREHGVWLVTGVNEVDPERPGTLYNSLLYHAPDGSLAAAPPQARADEPRAARLGSGRRSRAQAVADRRSAASAGSSAGRTTCRSRASRSTSRASRSTSRRPPTTATRWQATLVHIARESRAFVVAPSHFQRAASYPDDFPLRELLDGVDVLGRGGSAILGPDGAYLAGPLYDEEGVLYAELEPRSAVRGAAAFRPGRALPPAGGARVRAQDVAARRSTRSSPTRRVRPSASKRSSRSCAGRRRGAERDRGSARGVIRPAPARTRARARRARGRTLRAPIA